MPALALPVFALTPPNSANDAGQGGGDSHSPARYRGIVSVDSKFVVRARNRPLGRDLRSFRAGNGGLRNRLRM